MLDVYSSDDYAGMVSPRFAFYFGYERTFCPNHGNDAQCGCDENEWCFTVRHRGEEVARYTQLELDEVVKTDEPYEYLLVGIGWYLA